jgi:UDP-N-acetylmuramyl pentapeptide phosphotransferase/UDP-N-acetylglucosamine-1-phosphate transferase
MIAVPSLLVVAASAGFLGVNTPPARVFLGDSGSIPIGFLAGALGLAGVVQGAWPAWFPLLAFSPFIVDASVTLLRRLARGDAVWRAHREHAYQRLVRGGWSHRRLLLFTWPLMAAFAILAVLFRDTQHAGLLLLGSAAVYAWLLLWVERHWALHAGEAR